MNIGIVGHEAAKFTPETERVARDYIRSLLWLAGTVLVSGHCHLGGIDIWAEEEADALGRKKLIFPPKTRRWHDGFKPRNEAIASISDIVHCIVVAEYPNDYKGMRFDLCYHCAPRGHATDHIKSGGCWTALAAQRLGKPAVWHITTGNEQPTKLP